MHVSGFLSRVLLCLIAMSAGALAQASYTCNFTEVAIKGSGISGVYGLGINDPDVVVGSYYSYATQYAFVRDADGKLHDYLLRGTQMTTFNDINDADTIVGAVMTSQNEGHGIVGRVGKFSKITYPGAAITAAEGVNKSGEVVGFYSASGEQAGFLLSHEKFTAIQYLAGIQRRHWGSMTPA